MAKYDIDVNLVGQDGNAFFIMGTVQKALSRAGASREELDQYFEEATSGDYHHLLVTTMEWVNIK